jgi:hypothetical protein
MLELPTSLAIMNPFSAWKKQLPWVEPLSISSRKRG